MATGSSPHARGAPERRTRGMKEQRDHPRMRGEHAYYSRSPTEAPGIIPACAGSTMPASAAPSLSMGSSPHARGAPWQLTLGVLASRDHPRMRGEHPSGVAGPPALAGIIPACAGSTGETRRIPPNPAGSSPHARGAPTLHLRRKHSGWDHPRMRGEHHRNLPL